MTHLPGVLRRSLTLSYAEPHFTLVTACGKRGPIKTRESAAPPADLFAETDTTWERGVCPDCLVRWDEAEGGGALQIVWALNGKTEWQAGGAVVFSNPPTCSKCRGRHETRSLAAVFAAVVRP